MGTTTRLKKGGGFFYPSEDSIETVTVTKKDFVKATKGIFSNLGAKTLFDFITAEEAKSGRQDKLSKEFIQSGYVEYNSFRQWQQDYDEERYYTSLEDMEKDNNVVIRLKGCCGFIFQK